MSSIINHLVIPVNPNSSLSFKACNSSQRSNKLRARDIPLLKLLQWLFKKEMKFYYTKEQIPSILEQYGGKENSYEAFKKRRQRLEKMGYLQTYFIDGNRNRPKGIVITADGLTELNKFISSGKSKTKSDPAKTKNRPGEMQKLTRPLNHVHSRDNHDNPLTKMQTDNPKKYDFVMGLIGMGMHKNLAFKIVQRVPAGYVAWAYDQAKEKASSNPGAYMYSLLKRKELL